MKGISALRVQVGEMIFQQRELAELCGQLKALIQMQSQASKRPSEPIATTWT
jgi:hypothetical protein